MSTTTVPTAEVPESINPFGRIIGAIVDPKATFESIARRPGWLLPTVLFSLIFIGVVAAFSYRGGWPSYMQKQLERSSQFQQLPAAQQQRILATQVKYAPIGGYVEGVIVPVLLVVIVAAVFMGVFNMGVGTQLRFKTCLGIVSHAYVPGVISGLLGIMIIFLKDPATVDLQNLVASNVGSYMPDGTAKWLVSFLSSLDVFAFWEMGLMAIGFRAAAAPKKLSFGGAFGAILFVWFIYVLMKVGLTAAFS